MKSGYLGVYWHGPKCQWMIKVKHQGKSTTQQLAAMRAAHIRAAREYNYHAVRIKGPDARLNIVPEHLK